MDQKDKYVTVIGLYCLKVLNAPKNQQVVY